MDMLRLQFKKKGDGSTVLTAVRQDGTHTSTEIGPANGFGPVHDLAHYVVETSFGWRNAFLGLLASGHNIEDFNTSAKQWLPAEAVIAECVAGQLSQDAVVAFPLTADDFNWSIRQVLREKAPEITPEQLAGWHANLAELRQRWNTLKPGETLALDFSGQS
jgi:hypothetical protein